MSIASFHFNIRVSLSFRSGPIDLSKFYFATNRVYIRNSGSKLKYNLYSTNKCYSFKNSYVNKIMSIKNLKDHSMAIA